MQPNKRKLPLISIENNHHHMTFSGIQIDVPCPGIWGYLRGMAEIDMRSGRR